MFAIIIADFQFVRLLEVLDKLADDCESLIMMLLAIGAHIKLYIIMVKNKNVRVRELRLFAWSLKTRIVPVVLLFNQLFNCSSDRTHVVDDRLSLAYFHTFLGDTNYARIRYNWKENNDRLRR